MGNNAYRAGGIRMSQETSIKIIKKLANEKVVVIHETDAKDFEKECNYYLNKGYKLSSSYCGFVQSESYDFCGSYHAIFVKEEE